MNCWEDLYQDNGELQAHSQEIIVKLWMDGTKKPLNEALAAFSDNEILL